MIPKPNFIEPVTFAQGRAWRGGGDFLYEEKIDGRFAVHRLGEGGFQDTKNCAPFQDAKNTLLMGEEIKGGAHGVSRPTFYAFDCLEYGGEDIRRWPLRERLRVLDSICPRGDSRQIPKYPNTQLARPRVGQGGEFLEAIVAAGGEGIVVKPLEAKWGATWWKCKRAENFLCRVVELNPWKAAVRVEVQSQDGGWLALRNRFDQVSIGSVLKVVAFGRHKSGKLREARLDRDTESSWLVRQ